MNAESRKVKFFQAYCLAETQLLKLRFWNWGSKTILHNMTSTHFVFQRIYSETHHPALRRLTKQGFLLRNPLTSARHFVYVCF